MDSEHDTRVRQIMVEAFPAILLCPVLVLRTIMEDHTLREELPGYKEYAGRVRCLLVPGVW